WNGLPKPYRATVTQACEAINLGVLARYDAINPPALKRLATAGALLRQFPQPMLEAFYRATVDHFGEVAAKDAKFKKALESATAFLKDHLQWLQASDQASDAFQIAINGRA